VFVLRRRGRGGRPTAAFRGIRRRSEPEGARPPTERRRTRPGTPQRRSAGPRYRGRGPSRQTSRFLVDADAPHSTGVGTPGGHAPLGGDPCEPPCRARSRTRSTRRLPTKTALLEGAAAPPNPCPGAATAHPGRQRGQPPQGQGPPRRAPFGAAIRAPPARRSPPLRWRCVCFMRMRPMQP